MKKKSKTKQKVKEVKKAIGRLRVPPTKIVPNKKRKPFDWLKYDCCEGCYYEDRVPVDTGDE